MGFISFLKNVANNIKVGITEDGKAEIVSIKGYPVNAGGGSDEYIIELDEEEAHNIFDLNDVYDSSSWVNDGLSATIAEIMKPHVINICKTNSKIVSLKAISKSPQSSITSSNKLMFNVQNIGINQSQYVLVISIIICCPPTSDIIVNSILFEGDFDNMAVIPHSSILTIPEPQS